MAFEFFRDRKHAGRALARKLAGHAERPDVIVLALPRGGTPVAHEVARALGAPLDLWMVRKLGIPWNEEYAMGAIASGGEQWLDEVIVRELGISPRSIDEVVERERRELERRERVYRGGRPAPRLRGRVAILVDDGLATGSTMRVAVRAARRQEPARVVVAVPVAAPEAVDLLRADADEVVCVHAPDPFLGVGRWYLDFSQTRDEEVCALLEDVDSRHAALSA
ncbi:putative phosphoribosyl transferase [Variovorax sp. TBS-050B]|uniref:phosphoribosyltransferase n=1 Tax=Variovorax sp. TBS-050B TaxID=2940551 RepID=UPI0024760487|nr:phosphoribosyltransferase family protein [Variovorax sp. TBS-050B]MDH6594979.1 putative phosphoribosyl transferase [Variovorax sp. TBS-050B]